MSSKGFAKLLFISTVLVTWRACADIDTAIYLEGYGGGLFGRAEISHLTIKNIYNLPGLTGSIIIPDKKLSATFIAGAKLGAWFNNCLDHFGCYIDGCFNDLKYAHAVRAATVCYNSTEAGCHTGQTDVSISTRGHSGTLAFMLAYRACTEGEIEPYIGFGPAVFFARQCTSLVIEPHQLDDPNFSFTLNNQYRINPTKTSKNAACAALDVGIHQMLFDCLSLDYSFKYRYAPCCFAYCPTDAVTGQDQLAMKNRYHLCSFQIGLAYHF